MPRTATAPAPEDIKNAANLALLKAKGFRLDTDQPGDHTTWLVRRNVRAVIGEGSVRFFVFEDERRWTVAYDVTATWAPEHIVAALADSTAK